MRFSQIVSLFLIVSFVSFTACDSSSESTVDNSEQKPVLSLTQHDSTILTNTFVNSSWYEFGPRLRFLKDGAITGLGMMMPDSGSYEVTLWDLSDTSIVTTVTIAADSGELKYVAIDPVQVQTDDRYSVTILSNDWYWFEDISGKNNFLPQTFDNVMIEDYAYISGSTHQFPTDVFTDYLAGIQDIIFVQEK